MSTKEEKEVLKLLVQHVCRGFYEAKYTVVMDQLVRHPVLKEDDLAGRVGLQLKELLKITAVLHADKLLKVYRQNELKEGATRAQARQYFYIDYQHFCNVVKWRVAEMRRVIDSKLRNELDNKGYICPQCRRSYTPLDSDRLMDFSRGAFICEDCKAEVIENENAESVKGSQDRMQRFNHQMRFVREGLRKTEEMVLPAFDVQEWLRKNPSEEAKRAAERDGLKAAGANGEKKEDGMEIIMSVDKDEATRRAEREKEAEAKRQQNVMPSWHTKSTITGELTALGHAAASHAASTHSSSNAAILSGLGKAPNGTTSTELGVKVEQDVKPSTSKHSDYYDAYYASLQSSAVQTPSMDSWGGLNAEPEDHKPDLNYLNGRAPSYSSVPSTPDGGLNPNGKRTREEEGFTFGGDGGEMTLAEEVGFVGDDPTVYVQGKPMKFSEVTEEHHELMTEDEYTAFFDVVTSREG
ncbi:TFIIE alpha subunit-domain-containing protein [Hysterangium stoloniferum]|nr:TFIIE alpha subunit-domain-containing protein [Hysterangium stoloniferum]